MTFLKPWMASCTLGGALFSGSRAIVKTGAVLNCSVQTKMCIKVV
jgi:hypothetical protein